MHITADHQTECPGSSQIWNDTWRETFWKS